MRLVILIAAALSFSASARHLDRAQVGQDELLFPTKLVLIPAEEKATIEFEKVDFEPGPIAVPPPVSRKARKNVTAVLDLRNAGDALLYQSLMPSVGRSLVKLTVDTSGTILKVTMDSGAFAGGPPVIPGEECNWVLKTYFEPVTTYVEGKPVTTYVQRSYYHCEKKT